MEAADARNSVKLRLDISSTVDTFDEAIDEFVLSAVGRLSPIALRDVDYQDIDLTVDAYGEAVIDLSSLGTPLHSVRRAEVSSGGSYDSVDDTYHHGGKYYLRDLDSSYNTARLYGLVEYDLANVPSYLKLAVIWFAMSEFYDFLAGNKRKYNVYMGSGARTVENMREESDVYEQKANDYLNDRVELYGVK